MQDPSYPGAITSMVTFGDRVKGFLAMPENQTGPFGAVILGHERYGLIQHTLDLTAKFAAHGYIGLAPDLFSRWEGDMDALNRGDIQVTITDDDLKSYLGDSLDYLLNHPQVDPNRIVGMGVCQSGDYPLVLNSIRHEISANIVVYGGAQSRVWEVDEARPVPYETILEGIQAPILGIFGEHDQVVSVENVRRLQDLLQSKRKSYEFKLFRDMPHGWFNSTMPGRYRPKEAEQAWSLIMDYLRRVRAGEFPSDRVIWRFESNIAPDYDFSTKVRLA
ncbi:MAG: dienelactone hydrolase family protein [Chloroflexota bacterium]|nr:dienelactone hydrolase family protein [Chloroflexota bacterium]